MEVYRDNGIVLSYTRAIKRFAFTEGDLFISASIPTLKILLKNLGMKQDMSILIRQESSSIDLLVNGAGASLMFLNSKSRLHRTRILLTHDFIGKFLLHEDSFFTICEDPSYSTCEESETRGIKRPLDDDSGKGRSTYELVDDTVRSTKQGETGGNENPEPRREPRSCGFNEECTPKCDFYS
jgi:hypothetical protein